MKIKSQGSVKGQIGLTLVLQWFGIFHFTGCGDFISNRGETRSAQEVPYQEPPRFASGTGSDSDRIDRDANGIPKPVFRSFDLKISPEPAEVFTQSSLQYKVIGSKAIPPFFFSQVSGPGRINRSGLFLSQDFAGTNVIRVTDSRGTFNEFAVKVVSRTSETRTLEPNDTFYHYQWAFSNTSQGRIHAPEAWAIHNDCSSVVVAVIDSGIFRTHPDLAANIWRNSGQSLPGFEGDEYGWNFADDNNDTFPNLILPPGPSPSPNTQDYDHKTDSDHGTHVAGIIGAAGNNSFGLSGICMKASIMPVKVFGTNRTTTTSIAAEAIRYAVDMKAKIINSSFGAKYANIAGPGGTDLEREHLSNILRDAVYYASLRKVLFVASAGNGSDNADVVPYIPGSYGFPNMIVVASTTTSNAFAELFSNYGPNSVTIAAPGLDIYSTSLNLHFNSNPEPSYRWKSGTSQSAPMVSGAAALLWSYRPGLTMEEVKARIFDRSDTVAGLNGRVVKSRKLNLYKLLSDE